MDVEEWRPSPVLEGEVPEEGIEPEAPEAEVSGSQQIPAAPLLAVTKRVEPPALLSNLVELPKPAELPKPVASSKPVVLPEPVEIGPHFLAKTAC